MSGDREEILAAGRAAVVQIQQAFDAALEDVVRNVRERTGEQLLVRRPGVLDARWLDLAQMSWQASNFEAAVRLLRPVMEHSDRTLGAVLKTGEAILVRDVTRHLVEARVLPSARG
ncbi:hypothetical protein N4P33_15740 [Streptomyces sp. 15-116A]|uniref:hypothetical protein n=1 Tax=Streptomyces sp. 15-116A TaxID=2259035 RepID=UPI0021B39FC2|nr:hypothetical protein [Streptomyces sp. 15-116A]MCT7353614.1 hypothetical protein [Streptomyces sp. 15-116A]